MDENNYPGKPKQEYLLEQIIGLLRSIRESMPVNSYQQGRNDAYEENNRQALEDRPH